MLNKIMRNSKDRNNYWLKITPRKAYLVSIKPFFCLFCLFTFLTSATTAFAQTAKWRYAMTMSDGAKTYVNEEVRILPNGNKLVWEKIITPKSTSMVALTEWDCTNKRRHTRQITLYNSDDTVTKTQDMPARWDEIAPDSMAERHYTRICLPAPPVKWARISAPQTPLRQLPGSDSRIIRIAAIGERFEIVPESEERNWVNVVDPETQVDYWLLYKWFETIEDEQPHKKQNADAIATAAPAVRKQKLQKANAQNVKNKKARKKANQ